MRQCTVPSCGASTTVWKWVVPAWLLSAVLACALVYDKQERICSLIRHRTHAKRLQLAAGRRYGV